MSIFLMWVSTDPAADPLGVRLSFILCAEGIRGCSARTAQSSQGVQMLPLWELDCIHCLLLQVTAQLSDRTAMAIAELGEEWSQGTTQKCLYFIINFEPYVGIYSTKAFRDTPVWKYKLAKLRCFFVRLIFH